MFKREYYSHSSLQTFLNCPKQFEFRYIQRIPSKETIEGFLGSLVHQTLEIFYKYQARFNADLNYFALKRIYLNKWRRFWHKDIVKIKDKPTKEYLKIGLECIKHYYNSEIVKRNLKEKTLAIEKEINIQIGKFIFKGFIDRLVEKADGTIEIQDYKTGGSLPSKNEFLKNNQLALYQLAITKEFKDRDFVLVWHYLQHQKKIKIKKSKKDLLELKKKLVSDVEKIESTEEYLAKTSHLCQWCSFINICPLMKPTHGIEETLI